ncbi:MAG: hypothetical protein HFJ34_04695 [Clostridia bacterium]|nr:hypothetical protein [Clostridia bacterium]
MSQTNNLKLFKHEDVVTNTNPFDIEKSLNENWDKVDEAIEVNKQNIKQIGKISNLEIEEILKL